MRMLEEQRLEPDRAVVQRNGIGGCEDRDSGGGQDSGRWQTRAIDGVSATGQEGVWGMVQDGALEELMMEADREKGQRRAAEAEERC